MRKIIVVLLVVCAKIAQAQIYIDSYRFAQATPVNLLLDDYPGAAAAYSLRKLDKDYTGSAIQIRTTGTGTNQPAGALANIGFDSNGDLDETAIINHCLGTTCTVTTWYDQSGNGNNATQATAANQPTIYTGGAVVLEGGKPAINFDGTNDYFNLTSSIDGDTYISSFYVAKRKQSSNPLVLLASTSGELYNGYMIQNFLLTINTSGYRPYYILENFNQILISTLVPTGANYSSNYINSSLLTPGGLQVLSSGNIDYNAIGLRVGSYYSMGLKQELIIYSSNQSANRSNIETNINSYYSIY